MERKRRSRAAYALPSRLRNRRFRRRNRNEESKQDTPPPNCRNLRRTFQIPTAHDARFIVESVDTLTEQSKRGHLFYNGLVRNGILLYDNGGHVPCDCARPDPLRALEGAVAGFEKYFPDAVNLLYSVTTRLLPAENYRQSARRLHEACDKFYRHRMDGAYESFSRNCAARRTGRTGQALLPRVRRNFPLP